MNKRFRNQNQTFFGKISNFMKGKYKIMMEIHKSIIVWVVNISQDKNLRGKNLNRILPIQEDCIVFQPVLNLDLHPGNKIKIHTIKSLSRRKIRISF